MRIGLAGVGRIGAFHAATLHALADVDSLVVADADAGRAPPRRGELGRRARRRPTRSFGAGLDALVIAAATDAHAALIVAGGRGRAAGLLREAGRRRTSTARVAGPATGRRGAAPGAHRLPAPLRRRLPRGAGRRSRRGALGWLHTRARRHPRPGARRRRLHRRHPAASSATAPSTTSTSCAGSPAARSSRSTRSAPTGARTSSPSAATSTTSAALLTLDDGTLVTVPGPATTAPGYDVRLELRGHRATSIAVGLDDRAAAALGRAGRGLPAPAALRRSSGRGSCRAYVAELTAFVAVARGGRGHPVHGGRRARGALRRRGRATCSRREHRPVRRGRGAGRMVALTDRIAGAPISWGVCEVPGLGLPAATRRGCSPQMRERRAGGDRVRPRRLPARRPAGRRRPRCARTGCARSAGSSRSSCTTRRTTRCPRSTRRSTRFVAAGAGVARARRRHRPGRLRRAAGPGRRRLGAAARPTSTGSPTRAATRGVVAALHPHVGTMVETRRRGRAGAGRQRASPLCLDTGHLLVGGTDPVDLVRPRARAGRARPPQGRRRRLGRARSGPATRPTPQAVARGHVPPARRRATSTSPRSSALLEAGGYHGLVRAGAGHRAGTAEPAGDGPLADVRDEPRLPDRSLA